MARYRWASVTAGLVALMGTATAIADRAASDEGSLQGTIAFSSLAPRGWNVYLLDRETGQTRQLTDHPALDYNANFTADAQQVLFVSERDGNLELYRVGLDGGQPMRLTDDYALDDHAAPSPDGRKIAFVSTRQASGRPGRADNAVYVMQADGQSVERLSPADAADYSPAWSPCGEWIAVASGSGRSGGTAIFLMRSDGSQRRRVVDNGGWPTFASDSERLFFHSRREGHWAIWQVNRDGSDLERITPAGTDAFTPRAAAGGGHLVLAVQRDGSRQIDLLDLETREFTPLTRESIDHWNPAISPDARYVLYHKRTRGAATPNVERWSTPPDTDLQMLRVAGAFPSFSPDGQQMVLTGGSFARVDRMAVDGSQRETLFTGGSRSTFGLSWASRGDWIAFSHGAVFAGATASVNLKRMRPDGSELSLLTDDAGNNGFPSFSPDGRQLIFRSGRDGHKNLYLINHDGTGLQRLTEGTWTDTMPSWSPTGDWIVFASNREGNFDLWRIRPDGSDSTKVIGGGGRNNHPRVSPDGRWVVFTSQRAGYSAEEISLPRQPQPYGSLFLVQMDGTGLRRLTHNGWEDGTPAWGP